jgi:hypothetical protein
MDAIPSDEEVKTAVFDWLKTVDATQVTRKDLKQQIETKNGWNLDDKKVYRLFVNIPG